MWDTTDVVAKAWNQATHRRERMKQRNILQGDFEAGIGKPMNVIAEDLFPELTQEERERIMNSAANMNTVIWRHVKKICAMKECETHLLRYPGNAVFVL